MTEDRNELNEKARIEYGIQNAADLDEKTVKEEIKKIDDQAVEAKKEEAHVAREAEKAEDKDLGKTSDSEKEEETTDEVVDVQGLRNKKK